MSLEPEDYIELFYTVVRAVYDRQLDIPQAAELCYSAAQPRTTAVEYDILDEVKAELHDWIKTDLDSVIECKILQLSIPNLEDEDKMHVAQVVKLAIKPGWHWSHVHPNRANIDDALTEVGRRYLPEGMEAEMVRSTRDLRDQQASHSMTGAFRKNIEQEIDKFREELDALFPDPEKGG